MHALGGRLRNPLTQKRDSRDRTRVAAIFPTLQSSSEARFLALRCYLEDRPEKFFAESAYKYFLEWLQKRDETDGGALKQYLFRFDSEINRALLFLREINSEEWHDMPLKIGGDYDLVRFVDKDIHPTYLRLIEAVLSLLPPHMQPLSVQLNRTGGIYNRDGTDFVRVNHSEPLYTPVKVEPLYTPFEKSCTCGNYSFHSIGCPKS